MLQRQSSSAADLRRPGERASGYTQPTLVADDDAIAQIGTAPARSGTAPAGSRRRASTSWNALSSASHLSHSLHTSPPAPSTNRRGHLSKMKTSLSLVRTRNAMYQQEVQRDALARELAELQRKVEVLTARKRKRDQAAKKASPLQQQMFRIAKKIERAKVGVEELDVAIGRRRRRRRGGKGLKITVT